MQTRLDDVRVVIGIIDRTGGVSKWKSTKKIGTGYLGPSKK